LSSPIVRITSDKKLKLKGNVFTQLPYFEEIQNLDDSHELEDTYEFNDTSEINDFIDYILNSITTPTQVTSFSFDSQGNLIIPEFYTEWQGFDGIENIDSTTIQLDTTHSINSTLGIEELLSYLFSVVIQDIPIDRFSILNNKKILVPEILENQIL